MTYILFSEGLAERFETFERGEVQLPAWVREPFPAGMAIAYGDRADVRTEGRPAS
jgi:hypothetical protein